MFTPWGAAQNQTTLAPGVVEVDTASHGGIHLTPENNAYVHEAWRDPKGWYEEDCEWAIVAVTFPNLFEPDHVILAHDRAKNWLPDQYERVFKVQLLPGESYARREQIFHQATTDRYVAITAWGSGDGHNGYTPVPAGMVGVCARLGGRAPKARGTERYFLVPQGEYDQRDNFGFVVDETRHTEWPALVAA